MLRSSSMPARSTSVSCDPVLVRRIRSSEGEMCLMAQGSNKWLADCPNDTFTPELPGVDFQDIAEETLKKNKEWVKFQSKQEKRESEIMKKFKKERQDQVKKQLEETEKLLKKHTIALNQCQDRIKRDALLIEQKQAQRSLSASHDLNSLQMEAEHKTLEYNLKLEVLKESHYLYRELKEKAHQAQIASFEQYQSSEVLAFSKNWNTKHDEEIARLMRKTRNTEELQMLIDQFEAGENAVVAAKKKKLANTQEIRREQLIEEHKAQIRAMEQQHEEQLWDCQSSAQNEIAVIKQMIKNFEKVHFEELSFSSESEIESHYEIL